MGKVKILKFPRDYNHLRNTIIDSFFSFLQVNSLLPLKSTQNSYFFIINLIQLLLLIRKAHIELAKVFLLHFHTYCHSLVRISHFILNLVPVMFGVWRSVWLE